MHKKQVAVTFDDLPATGCNTLSAADVTALTSSLLLKLRKASIPATAFVNVGQISSEAHRKTIDAWQDSGVLLGNHTFSHCSFSDVLLDTWKRDVLKGDPHNMLQKPLAGVQAKYFRYPFLDMGVDPTSRSLSLSFLQSHGYLNVPVTVDALDWMFTRAYDFARSRQDSSTAATIVAEFLVYVRSAFLHSEDSFTQSIGFVPRQILLLHSNHLIANHLSDLLGVVTSLNYDIVPLEEVLKDETYALHSSYFGRIGTTWTNHLAFTSGLLLLSDIGPVIPTWRLESKEGAFPKPVLR